MADLHTVDDATGRLSVVEAIVPETRPWGWYAVLGEPDHHPIAAVKVLHVEPGGMLSLQTHEQRRERWLPITEGLGAIIGDKRIELLPGHTYEIDIGIPHRLFDIGGSGGSVIETMYGTYDEDDIIRLSDQYNR
jgi:mannose-6-phosphate isomerase-like protein (cupin superfamily)